VYINVYIYIFYIKYSYDNYRYKNISTSLYILKVLFLLDKRYVHIITKHGMFIVN